MSDLRWYRRQRGTVGGGGPLVTAAGRAEVVRPSPLAGQGDDDADPSVSGGVAGEVAEPWVERGRCA
ncbi:hypothetical protein ACX6XY_15540 [Streptomyces sp. O3]